MKQGFFNFGLVVIMGLPFLTGCAKIAHMQELLRLKSYSENKDLQAKSVEKQNQNFEKLLAAVQEDPPHQYSTERKFRREFGRPIFIKQKEKDGEIYNIWLYRYSTKFFNAEKVYVSFNQKGKLVSWEHVLPSQGASKPSPPACCDLNALH
ncbi:MAG: hypothetical protein NUV91_09935 [Candidatus Omnitrophica bacterium]|nr:hypothetical protein [Candidatus Omnitrophota bacterium]